MEVNVLKFICKKIVHIIVVLLGVSILTFCFGRFAPGDPVDALLSGNQSPTLAERQMAREHLGIDSNIVVQYLKWTGNLLKGDLGTSYKSGLSVSHELVTRFPVTMRLAFGATIIMLIIAFPLGLISALYKNRWPDTFIRLLNIVFMSVPTFCIGIVLIMFFGVKLKLLPVMGVGSIKNMIMPSIALGSGMGAVLSRLIRNQILEVEQRDYVYAAKAFGVKRSIVIRNNIIKPAMMPIITSIGLSFGGLLGGSAIIETLFALPGAGSYVVSAIYCRDYPVIQAYALLMALIYILMNALVDFSYYFISPQVRKGVMKS